MPIYKRYSALSNGFKTLYINACYIRRSHIVKENTSQEQTKNVVIYAILFPADGKRPKSLIDVDGLDQYGLFIVLSLF